MEVLSDLYASVVSFFSQEAFWALHSLLYGERHLMHGFFIPGFPKLMRFQAHHDRILKKMMPRLKKHLVSARDSYHCRVSDLRVLVRAAVCSRYCHDRRRCPVLRKTTNYRFASERHKTLVTQRWISR